MPFRERVIMERLGLKEASEASSEIVKNDAAHARIMRGFFGVDWEDPQLYHVVLNTASVPVDTCVRIVRLLADDPAFQESAASRAALADKLIQARARSVLDASLSDKSINRSVDIAVVEGKVTLGGVLVHADLGAAVDQIRRIEGVTGVDNNVQQIRNYGYECPAARSTNS